MAAFLENNLFGPRLPNDPGYPIEFEVENAADVQNTLSTRISVIALHTTKEIVKWSAGGAAIGGCLLGGGAFLLNTVRGIGSDGDNDREDQIDIKQASQTGALLGAMLGGGIAGLTQWYQTRDFQIRLEADFQNARKDPDYSEKARDIFAQYLETIGESKDEIICPISLDIFIYPVKADDEHVYEYQFIVAHIKEFENKLAAWKDYEATRLAALQGNPALILSEKDRPHSSPYRGAEISVQNLKLDLKTMENLSH